ncbi:hypothetical protein Glove_259g40 [Diversispora epigaea]|uniref:Uncharacterized protein n=1 Tax=Diversispora epigaea TaxID=1348612 RepID=A0A397I6K1_9GLOM|nr:hypothetical protein Glove_259g40 [Diversispora epigaea]
MCLKIQDLELEYCGLITDTAIKNMAHHLPNLKYLGLNITEKALDIMDPILSAAADITVLSGYPMTIEAWRSDVGYNYSVESITDKDQLEHEMIEFILGIRTIQAQWEYFPSSLMNCIRLLSNFYVVLSFISTPWWRSYKILTKQFTFTSNGGIHFAKNYQKNDQGGVDKNSDALIIPVSPDTEVQGPVHDFKFYFSKRPLNSSCDSLYLRINKEEKGIHFAKNYQKNDQGGVDKNSDALIIPVSPDTEVQGPVHDFKFYFSKRPLNSSCDSLYLRINKEEKDLWFYDIQLDENASRNLMKDIYQQKEDSLSLLINNVGLEPLSNNKSSSNSSNKFSNNSQEKVTASKNRKQIPTTPRSSVFAPFRPPLKNSSKINIPSHLSLHLEPSHLRSEY